MLAMPFLTRNFMYTIIAFAVADGQAGLNGRRDRPDPRGRRRAGRALEHGVQGRPGLGRRSAQAIAHRLGPHDPLADEQRACHRGRPGPLARLVTEASIANSFRPNPPARNRKAFAFRPSWAPTPRPSWRSSATMPGASCSASAGCCASCDWQPGHVTLPEQPQPGVGAQVSAPRASAWLSSQDQLVRCLGPARSGIAISASWPSSAPTPSS